MPDPLTQLLAVLRIIQAIYFSSIKEHVHPLLPREKSHEPRLLKTCFHALVSVSLSETSFAQLLKDFLKEHGSIILGLNGADVEHDDDAMEDDHQFSVIEAQRRTADVMISIDEVGLGGSQAQQIFAEVMSGLLTAHVNSTYARQWTSPSTVPARLQVWVEEHFSKFVVQVLACLSGDAETQDGRATQVTIEDVTSWQQRAISDLGTLRLKELFEIIIEWDSDTRGAIEDLKQYLTTTTARAHLLSHFSSVISQRLLQPGASTTEILQIYICIIRAFAVLDPKGVLLERLARPIRRYLRDREDTVKIIVGGLLADPNDDTTSTDALVELAIELDKMTDVSGNDDYGELDWDDMTWVPDPVDAGPEYKKTKSSDVIGTLISLFESKDVFVKEFQNVLGERLLKTNTDFDKEVRVLELLKLRFGDSPLQPCEVMLRDVLESRRTDTWVKGQQRIDDSELAVSTKILSRLFWPSLHSETFVLPPEMRAFQEHYSAGFERYKTSRKLTWLDALGQVTVELQLEDRTIHETVQTWQASVIYAFQTVDKKSEPVTKTVDQLVEELEMDEDLVTNAITFWVGKLVLLKSPTDTYSVLEKLPPTATSETGSGSTAPSAVLVAAAAAQSASAASSIATSAIRSEEDILEEKMTSVYWQFIVAMLTNQGPMPLQNIVMMLNFAVPGGFPYGNEELRAYLGRKIQERKMELSGGNYKIIKGAT